MKGRAGRASLVTVILALTVVIVAGVCCVILFVVPGTGQHLAQRRDDQNRMRQIALLVGGLERFPVRDGRFDVYQFVRDGVVSKEDALNYFRSERQCIGPPSVSQMWRGDYTAFPWERRIGDADVVPSGRVPLLWERRSDAAGKFLVAMTDGTVEEWDETRRTELR